MEILLKKSVSPFPSHLVTFSLKPGKLKNEIYMNASTINKSEYFKTKRGKLKSELQM